MSELLQQAIDSLRRAEVNHALAQIQNIRNLRHDQYCAVPSSDVEQAITLYADSEMRLAVQLWDIDYTVKGLA